MWSQTIHPRPADWRFSLFSFVFSLYWSSSLPSLGGRPNIIISLQSLSNVTIIKMVRAGGRGRGRGRGHRKRIFCGGFEKCTNGKRGRAGEVGGAWNRNGDGQRMQRSGKRGGGGGRGEGARCEMKTRGGDRGNVWNAWGGNREMETVL